MDEIVNAKIAKESEKLKSIGKIKGIIQQPERNGLTIKMANGIDPKVEKIIDDAKDVLRKHQKMATTNTVYNADRTIKDRDLTCLCGYKGNDGWVNHILGELMNVGLRPMTDEDVADILMNRIR